MVQFIVPCLRDGGVVSGCNYTGVAIRLKFSEAEINVLDQGYIRKIRSSMNAVTSHVLRVI